MNSCRRDKETEMRKREMTWTYIRRKGQCSVRPHGMRKRGMTWTYIKRKGQCSVRPHGAKGLSISKY